MTMNQKKALYAFGSPDREATVNRFCTLAELAPDPAVKRFFLAIAREMNAPTADSWYRCMFFNLRLEMEAYLRYEQAFERIVSGCPAENCEDGVEYNKEWEDDEYDPDEV